MEDAVHERLFQGFEEFLCRLDTMVEKPSGKASKRHVVEFVVQEVRLVWF